MILVYLNGDKVEFDNSISLTELLNYYNIDSNKVAIELNATIIQNSEYSNTIIKDKDIIEIVHFIGGG